MPDQIVAILRELVAVNSINATLSGGPGEKEISGWVCSYLGRLGLGAKVQKVSGERANVVALVRGGQPIRRCS